MTNKFYEKRFHYEKECQRIDAPKENMGEWLDWQAVDMVNKETDRWVTYRTRLEKQEDGSHEYVVLMESISHKTDK